MSARPVSSASVAPFRSIPAPRSSIEMSSAQVHQTAARLMALLQPPKEREWMSDTMSAAQDTGCDLAALQCFFFDHAFLNSLKNFTGLNAWLAYSSYLRACKNEKEAERVGYKGELQALQRDKIKAVLTCGTGALYFGVRGMSFAAFVKGVDTSSFSAPTLLGRVTYGLGLIGSSLWGIYYLISVWIHKTRGDLTESFRAKFEASCKKVDLNDPASLEKYVRFFEKWSSASDLEIEESIFKKHSADALVEEALSAGAELVKKLSDQPMDDQTCKEVVKQFLGELLGRGKNVRALLVDLGFQIRALKLKQKRELKFSKMTSSESVREMRSIGCELREARVPLSERLQAQDSTAISEAQEFVKKTSALVQKIDGELNKSWWMKVGYIFANLVGLAATISGVVGTGGVLALVILVLYITVAITLTCLDAHQLYQSAQKAEKGTFDDTMFLISMAIYAISLILALIVISVFTLGLPELISALVVGFTGMGVNLYAYTKINQSEERHAYNHPELKDFFGLLMAPDAPEDFILEIFKKLPEQEQERLSLIEIYPKSQMARAVVFQRLQEMQRDAEEQLVFSNNLQQRIRAVRHA